MIPGPSGGYESQTLLKKYELQICKSTRKGVPKRSYEIEDFVFLVFVTELDEHNSVTEDLSRPKRVNVKRDERRIRVYETNKVWNLLDLRKKR